MDTTALIRFKSLVPLRSQWDLLTVMTRLVEEGRVALIRQVVKEMSVAKFPDAPGAWVAQAKRRMKYPQPSLESLVEVLDVAEQLVEADQDDDDREVADPYVAALAVELLGRYPEAEIVVVTDDRVDRLPVKLSLATACDRLKVTWCSPEDLFTWVSQQATHEDDLRGSGPRVRGVRSYGSSAVSGRSGRCAGSTAAGAEPAPTGGQSRDRPGGQQAPTRSLPAVVVPGGHPPERRIGSKAAVERRVFCGSVPGG